MRVVALLFVCLVAGLCSVSAARRTSQQSLEHLSVSTFSPFKVFCFEHDTSSPSSPSSSPALLFCTNLAGGLYHLQQESHGDKSASLITEYQIKVGPAQKEFTKAFVSLNPTTGQPRKKWTDRQTGQFATEPLEPYRKISVYAFVQHKLPASKVGYDKVFYATFSKKEAATLVEKCKKFDVNCWFVFPKPGQAGVDFTATKLRSLKVSEFLRLDRKPALPASLSIPASPFDEASPANDAATANPKADAAVPQERPQPQQEEQREEREVEVARPAENRDMVVSAVDMQPVTADRGGNQGGGETRRLTAYGNNWKGPGWFSVPTHTTTGRWHCGGLPYHPKYQACCPGPAVVPLGEKCP